MEKHDINKIHNILLAKKKKYKLISLFLPQKALVVDFIPLEEIPSEYCSEQKTLENAKEINSYLPKKIGEHPVAIQHSRSEIALYTLQNVLVPGDSSFFLTSKKDKVFYEKIHQDNRSIYLYNHKNIAFHSDKLAKINNFKVQNHNYEAVYFGGTFSFNYYHFFIEILSKTKYLHKIPNHENLTIIFDKSIEQNENLKTLAEFFLKDYHIEYLDRNFYHQFNKLWFVTTPNPTIPNVTEESNYEATFTKLDPESISYLQERSLQFYNRNLVNVSAVSKIFLARKSALRKYNEVELLEISQKYGFQPVYFEDLNIHEQIFIMKNADYIIGASGAAWTNLLFSKSNAKGLTWLGTVWGDFSVFSTLAVLVGFDLNYIRNQSETSYFHADYTIDSQIFETEVIKLLEL